MNSGSRGRISDMGDERAGNSGPRLSASGRRGAKSGVRDRFRRTVLPKRAASHASKFVRAVAARPRQAWGRLLRGLVSVAFGLLPLRARAARDLTLLFS